MVHARNQGVLGVKQPVAFDQLVPAHQGASQLHTGAMEDCGSPFPAPASSLTC